MAEPHALFYFVASALLLLPSQIHSLHSGDHKVLISNSGATRLGEITEFDAEVLLNSKPETRTRYASNENVTYEFSWKVSSASGPWIKHNKTTHRWDSFPWRWSSGGQKTVSVYVRILVWSYRNVTDDRRYHNGYNVYHAMNRTDVTVTGSNDVNYITASLNAHQDSPDNKNGSNIDHKTFVAGMVHLEVIIQKPQDLDLDEITFDWNFGDGSQLHNSQLQNVTHNFTTVKSCAIIVNIHGCSRGTYYSGTANKTLEFKANVQRYLEIRSSAGPKLPSSHANAIPKNSPVTFEMKFKDPFKVITGVSIDWKFGDGSLLRKRKNTTIVHEYDKEGCYAFWATIRVNTKYFGKTPKLDPVIKTLCVRERVYLVVKHTHFPGDKRIIFNISCNGSLPVSFHWCVSRQCNLPPGDICSPIMEHKNSCSLIVNHVFHDSGKYCVNVGVRNDVSGTNTSLMVQIPGDPLPTSKHSTGKNSAGMFVSLFIVIFLLITVTVIVVRKWIYKRREMAEKADFDFRDEDTASLSSVDLFGKHSCFPRCRVWGSCTRQEYVPLRIQGGGYRLYSL